VIVSRRSFGSLCVCTSNRLRRTRVGVEGTESNELDAERHQSTIAGMPSISHICDAMAGCNIPVVKNLHLVRLNTHRRRSQISRSIEPAQPREAALLVRSGHSSHVSDRFHSPFSGVVSPFYASSHHRWLPPAGVQPPCQTDQ
jgi:hypothetical protein